MVRERVLCWEYFPYCVVSAKSTYTVEHCLYNLYKISWDFFFLSLVDLVSRAKFILRKASAHTWTFFSHSHFR